MTNQEKNHPCPTKESKIDKENIPDFGGYIDCGDRMYRWLLANGISENAAAQVSENFDDLDRCLTRLVATDFDGEETVSCAIAKMLDRIDEQEQTIQTLTEKITKIRTISQ